MNPVENVIKTIWEANGPMIARQIKDILEHEHGIERSERTITRIMKKVGIQPIGQKFGSNIRFKCSDGHVVESYAEAQICELLHELEICHYYDYRILPSLFRVDFWLPEYKAGIEYQGITNDPTYIGRNIRKEQFYRKYNIPVVFLTPKDDIGANLISRIDKELENARKRKRKYLLALTR